MIGSDFIGKYVIVRTFSAGVFAGILVERDGKECLVKGARRLWYWEGAASLSQLSQDGTNKPDECKFPCEVSSVLLTEVVEILEISQEAEESIKNVNLWKAEGSEFGYGTATGSGAGMAEGCGNGSGLGLGAGEGYGFNNGLQSGLGCGIASGVGDAHSTGNG